jgi:hypothetical protein
METLTPTWISGTTPAWFSEFIYLSKFVAPMHGILSMENSAIYAHIYTLIMRIRQRSYLPTKI